MVTTPDGRLSKYFYGIDYAPKDLKLGLVDSGQNRVGTMTDKLLLYCYHYDPATGKYGLAVVNLIRAGGVLTLLAMAAFGFVFWRRERDKAV
jgi:protein SCO1/2